ncbi:MAG TPA: beta galactosidase jelly roll domain-containing protein, partial [Edaphobacter sp.]
MHRRDFLKTTSTLLAATALPAMPAFAETTATSRTVLPINRGWRYHPSKVEGAYAVDFNDATFERVVIPHTNVKLPWHNFDDKDYEFVSTYRRRFKTPPEARGKRVFVDFEGAMTASTVWINGVSLGEYKGGFTPFSFELTPHLRATGDNVLTVYVDSTERNDIPPFGHQIDYLTFGGIYREVSLRIVPQTYIDNVFARPRDVLSGKPSLDVDCFLAGTPSSALTLEVELRNGDRTIAKTSRAVTHTNDPDPNASANPTTSAPVYASTQTKADPARQTISLENLDNINLWDIDNPNLYTVNVRL